MDAPTIISLVLGSTVLGAIISSLFTRKTDKEAHNINLLDRAYKEIERLDGMVEDRDRIIDDKDERIAELEKERFHVKQ